MPGHEAQSNPSCHEATSPTHGVTSAPRKFVSAMERTHYGHVTTLPAMEKALPLIYHTISSVLFNLKFHGATYFTRELFSMPWNQISCRGVTIPTIPGYRAIFLAMEHPPAMDRQHTAKIPIELLKTGLRDLQLRVDKNNRTASQLYEGSPELLSVSLTFKRKLNEL